MTCKVLWQGLNWLSPLGAGLQEIKQSCGAEKGAQSLGCSLPLLGMLSGDLVVRDLMGGEAYLGSLLTTGHKESRQSCG